MIPRTIRPFLVEAAAALPAVWVTGPRESGKTTLVRATFPELPYLSLETPDTRMRALLDPRGFLNAVADGAVLDEVHRAPDLLPCIRDAVADDPRPGRFVLTSSQDVRSLDPVPRTAGGQRGILSLYPLSLSELEQREPWDPQSALAPLPGSAGAQRRSLFEVLHAGFYPGIHGRGIDAAAWLADHRETFVERDLRQLVNVRDGDAFRRFLGVCAGRNGQLLNATSLGNDAGVDHTTVRRWLSMLEASFIITLLTPHRRSFGKRTVKSPKIYFLDSGLLCSLLGIRSTDDLRLHPLRGAVFETFVLAELMKAYAHRGLRPPVHFWRDSSGHEIDFLIETGPELLAIEARSGETAPASFFDGLEWWRRLVDDPDAPSLLLYGGDEDFAYRGMEARSWRALSTGRRSRAGAAPILAERVPPPARPGW